MIAEELDIQDVLTNSATLDGGYVMCGMFGHGDAFVLEKRNTTTYYYADDEIIVATSERPVIQTAFNVRR